MKVGLFLGLPRRVRIRLPTQRADSGSIAGREDWAALEQLRLWATAPEPALPNERSHQKEKHLRRRVAPPCPNQKACAQQ